MPRRPHLIPLLLLAALLAGCGSHVTPAARGACRTFLSDLPSHVAGQRRTSEDRDALTASYGKPAITLTCGVDRPDGLEATSTCQMVGTVGWFVPPDQIGHTAGDVTATTVNRRPRVEVRVPKHYWPSTAALSDLRGDVVSHLARTDACS